jgi:Entner-Doudoroff aldolase
MDTTFEALGRIGIVPVVELPGPAAAVPLARTLLESGIGCIEVTFRAAGAPEAIAEIGREVPEMIVGAGTVLTAAQARAAIAAGARFVVLPGFSADVVESCMAAGIAVLPGACTPTEVMMALDHGLDTVKFFPAEAAGGERVLRALRGPFRNVSFVPTGGIDASNLATYLGIPGVIACGGSWFVRKEWLASGNWAAVGQAAAEAVAIVAGRAG